VRRVYDGMAIERGERFVLPWGCPEPRVAATAGQVDRWTGTDGCYLVVQRRLDELSSFNCWPTAGNLPSHEAR
jgi:hypothetical protein